MQKILRPEITNIHSAAWSKIQSSWVFWFLIIGGVLFVFVLQVFSVIVDIFNALLFASVPVLIYVAYVYGDVKKKFWEEFAKVNGWEYLENGDASREVGLMFRQGHSKKISNQISGVLEDGRHFKIFEYEFSIGHGKQRRVYNYVVFSFKFDGSFPELYLNNKHNSYNIYTGKKLSLPKEFEEKFTLSAPEEYEIEALEIFTPDVLAALIDGDFKHDIEFIDSRMIIFRDKLIYDFNILESELRKALELEDLLDQTLDRVKFKPIGNRPYHL